MLQRILYLLSWKLFENSKLRNKQTMERADQTDFH
jgi:hypothetical protein